MKWPRRKKKKAGAPGSPQSDEIPLDLESTDFKTLEYMVNNVMWCRQNLESMMDYIHLHRQDGHECPPFCFPAGVGLYLNELPRGHLMMLLLVLMKDLEMSYVFEEPES